MGDIADWILDQIDFPDPDGMDELRECPKCGYEDCHVDVNWKLTCPKCGYKGKI